MSGHDMHNIRWEEEPDLKEYQRLYAAVMSGFESEIGSALIAFEALAERGSAASMFCLAWAYSTNGGARTKDVHKACYWFGRAHQRGYATASFYYGALCSELHDHQEAFAAFSRGAGSDYLPAIYRLALAFREGHGTAPDIDRCRALLERAAKRGHFFARRDLAGLLIKGRYGPRQATRGALMLLHLYFDATIVFPAWCARRGVDTVLIDERVLA
jgi:uncharacterized protein